MNTVLNAIGDGIFAALSWMHPVLAILVLAVLFAAAGLLVFKWTTDQDRVRAAKGPVKAHLLALLLFRHDLRVLFRSLGAAFLGSLANLRFLLLPMAVMLVPMMLLFIQIDLRLGRRALDVGEAAVLRVHLREGASPDGLALSAPEGIDVETPGVRVRDPRRGLHEVDFRIRARAPGRHEVAVADETGPLLTKSVHVGEDRVPLSTIRPSRALLARVFAPGEPPVPVEGPVESVELAYEPVTYAFLGIDWAWWVLLLVFLIPALYLLRGPLGVEF